MEEEEAVERAGWRGGPRFWANRPRLSNIARCLACLTLLPRQSKEPTRDPNKTSLGPSRSMRHRANGAECSNNPEDNPVATMEMDTEPSGMSGIPYSPRCEYSVADCRLQI